MFWPFMLKQTINTGILMVLQRHAGSDGIDMNTFPPAEYFPPTTRRLFNTWKTGFVINVSQCYEPNHEQRLSDATALACGAD